MSKDYYELLGVDKSATADDIKKAYRKKAMEHHPDRHGGDTGKEQEFKVINEAYAVLSDPAKKSRYDQFGSADGGAWFGGMGWFDFSDINVEDIFSSVFGNMGFGWRSARKNTSARDLDIHAEVRISFAESFSGVKKTLKIQRMTPCEVCHSHGTKDGKAPKKCHTCHGAGYVTRTTRSIFGMMQQNVVCETCEGDGVLIDDKCGTCHGHWSVQQNVDETLDIPAGIDDGMTIRASGRWHIHAQGTGDLYITCHVEQSIETLVRHGSHILTTLRISPVEAVLWVTRKIRFPIIWDRDIRIAAGTQHGKKIQLTGDGMPLVGKKSHGDLIITLEILVPAKLSKEQKKLYEELLNME